MITKKNPKYDLEKRRKRYFNLGLLVAGSITLAAFRWGTPVDVPKEQYEPKLELPTEIYEVVKIIEPQPQVQSRPQQPEIFDPNKIKQVEHVDTATHIASPDPILEPFPFEGPIGMGNWGLNNVVDPITINSEDAEEMPSFPGGDMEMSKFIQKMYKLPIYLDRSEQGTIYVKFVVSEKGEIKNVSIERGINPDMDKEAMRVVKAMPNWTPGKYRGRNVSVRMIIPIKIRYQ